MQLSDDAQSIEVAMKIDASDLESALKRRYAKAVDVDKISDAEAEESIGEYLRSTIVFQNKPLSQKQFNWVGWRRQATHAWVFFELPILQPTMNDFAIQFRTLYEVEPEMQHVVVLATNAGGRTVIVRSADTPVTISRSR